MGNLTTTRNKDLATTRAQNGALGGRPKGTKNRLTILKEKAMEKMEKSISIRTAKLVDAMTNIALGTHKMVRKYTDDEGRIRTETIRDEKRMQELLDTGTYGIDYIILQGKEGDWKAGNALLDRAFGKAPESVKHSGEVVFSLRGLAESRRALDVDNEDVTDEE